MESLLTFSGVGRGPCSLGDDLPPPVEKSLGSISAVVVECTYGELIMCWSGIYGGCGGGGGLPELGGGNREKVCDKKKK